MMLKRTLILIISSLLLMSCSKKTEPIDPTDAVLEKLATIQIEVPEGITGNCINTLKAYYQVVSYMYDDPSSKNYNRKSPSERAESAKNMINTIKTKYSQEQCKKTAYSLMISIDQMKNDK